MFRPCSVAKKHVSLPPLCACPHAAKSEPFDAAAVYKVRSKPTPPR